MNNLLSNVQKNLIKNGLEIKEGVMRLLLKDQKPVKFIKKDGSEYNIKGNIQSGVNKMTTASVN